MNIVFSECKVTSTYLAGSSACTNWCSSIDFKRSDSNLLSVDSMGYLHSYNNSVSWGTNPQISMAVSMELHAVVRCGVLWFFIRHHWCLIGITWKKAREAWKSQRSTLWPTSVTLEEIIKETGKRAPPGMSYICCNGSKNENISKWSHHKWHHKSVKVCRKEIVSEKYKMK